MSQPPNKPREEKEEEKRHEKEEKGRSDPLSTLVWALILIWAGLVLLADNLGLLAFRGLVAPGVFPFSISAWGVIFAGAGVIILLEVVVRLVVPAYRRPVAGSVVLGFVFLGIGLGQLISWGVIWAIILIVLGLIILLRAFGWRT